MSTPAPEYYPPFGLYQGPRYDSLLSLRAVVTIAHANMIEYFTKQGLDHEFITPRPAIGFTFTSQKDNAQTDSTLWADRFDPQAFREIIDTFPMPETPLVLADPHTQNSTTRPRSFGILLAQCPVDVLKRQAAAVQLAAFEVGGFALRVRSNFAHINLFRHGIRSCRPHLAAHQREKVRSIIGQARQEVGIRQVYLGKLLVGAEIGVPLPDDVFRTPRG
jgi:hypothetical protein